MSEVALIENPQSLIPLDGKGQPKYVDLVTYNKLVNTSPRKDWIKTNKHSNNAKYLPIRIVEELLTEMYPFWQAEQQENLKYLVIA